MESQFPSCLRRQDCEPVTEVLSVIITLDYTGSPPYTILIRSPQRPTVHSKEYDQ